MAACKGHVPAPVPKALQNRFDPHEIHLRPEAMADFAKAWTLDFLEPADLSGAVKLPFCHTVFAESYGALVNFGDWLQGPRVSAPALETAQLPTVTALKQLKASSQSRISVVLDAIKLLATEAINPVLVLEGPFTLLTQIIGLEVVLRGYKKEPEAVHALLTELTSDLIKYAYEAVEAGIASISFADPLAVKSLLGPRVFEKLALPHLGAVAAEFDLLNARGIKIHVCPVLKSGCHCFDAYASSCGSLNQHAFF